MGIVIGVNCKETARTTEESKALDGRAFQSFFLHLVAVGFLDTLFSHSELQILYLENRENDVYDY